MCIFLAIIYGIHRFVKDQIELRRHSCKSTLKEKHPFFLDYEEMTQNPKFMLIYKGLKKPLKEFIGEENMPEEENLLKIIGKVNKL